MFWAISFLIGYFIFLLILEKFTGKKDFAVKVFIGTIALGFLGFFFFVLYAILSNLQIQESTSRVTFKTMYKEKTPSGAIDVALRPPITTVTPEGVPTPSGVSQGSIADTKTMMFTNPTTKFQNPTFEPHSKRKISASIVIVEKTVSMKSP